MLSFPDTFCHIVHPGPKRIRHNHAFESFCGLSGMDFLRSVSLFRPVRDRPHLLPDSLAELSGRDIKHLPECFGKGSRILISAFCGDLINRMLCVIQKVRCLCQAELQKIFLG